MCRPQKPKVRVSTLIGVSPRLAGREGRGNYLQRFAKRSIDRSADTTSIAKMYRQIQLVGQFIIFLGRMIVSVPFQVQIKVFLG